MHTFKATPLNTFSHSERLREGRYSLVFGTSHSALITPEFFREGKDTLNFHALYGNPRSVADFLGSLEPTQVNNISEIFFLLDIHVYGDDTYRPVDTYDNWFSRVLYRARRIGPYLTESFDKIYKNLRGAYIKYVDPRGHTVILTELNQCNLPVRRNEFSVTEIDERTMTALSRVKSFAEQNGIDTTFVTPAMFHTFLDTLDKEKLWHQKQKLIRILGGYHDFIFYNHPLNLCKFFSDPRHLNKNGLKEYMRLVRSGAYFTKVPRPVR